MILLDTHIWIWWVQDDERLPARWRDELDRTTDALGVSISPAGKWRSLLAWEGYNYLLQLVIGYPPR